MKELMEAHDAAFYDAAISRAAKYEHRYVPLWEAAAALISGTDDVVELGCGTGRFSSFVIDLGCEYQGIDFAPALVKEARRHEPRGTFVVGDLRTLDIPPADVYVALEVLEHLDDDLALLKRLPKGARVVMSVPSRSTHQVALAFPA